MRRRSEVIAWIALGVLLAAGLPLFLCMPLWADAIHYDICARTLLCGGVPYRDIFDMNLPGMVWIHAVVRSLVGWRSEALRAVDILVVSAVMYLLTGWLRHLGVARPARAWTVVGLYAFYLSLTEWCHCQRDTWMLLPALLALHLRRRQLERLLLPEAFARTLAAGSLLEGLLWGVAIWIKPFVLLPVVSCWLVTTLMARPIERRRFAADVVGLLAGGLLTGGAGCMWLWWSGTWPHLWQVFFNWNAEYYNRSPGFLACTRLLYHALAPWAWIHFLALPCAVAALAGTVAGHANTALAPGQRQRALLASFYLAWLMQAAWIQHPFDYVLVPPILIGIALVAGHAWLPRQPRLRWSIVTAFVILAAWHHPLLHEGRLGLWARCWREGSSAELRDRLTLLPGANSPAWTDLERVTAELRRLQLKDGELTCFDNSLQPLYLELSLRPSTRFLHFGTILLFFPSHHEEIRQVLEASRQRYVVSDLRAAGLTPAQVAKSAGQLAGLPPDFPDSLRDIFPWSEPVVFRTDRYVVHAVRGPVGPLVPAALGMERDATQESFASSRKRN